MPRTLFRDRREAGRKLAMALGRYAAETPLILALPRGGVPVAYEVALALDAPLDLLLVRKIGAPGHEEYGIGAVIDGADPQLVLNEDVVRMLSPDPGYIRTEMQRQIEELERRRRAYMGDRPAPDLGGRTVVVIDDGIATGGTMRAALRGARKHGLAKLILGVPVAPKEVLASLREECDDIVCLASPDPFHAVGAWYADFTQTGDDEVKVLLAKAEQRFARSHARG